MDKTRAIYAIENSFLSSLVRDEDVTDISFNGVDIYYVSNSLGRKKSQIVVEAQVAKDFIRQIANLSEKQFSYTVPILDISIGKYRINATHSSIGKIEDEGVITFSIRIASSEERINRHSDFFNRDIVQLLKCLLKNRQSIIIGGLTSTGKTEFQKFMLKQLKQNERVIVIDNVLELDQVRNEYLDLVCWQIDDNNSYSTPSILIKNALRNNPDWLILAEARGQEMIDVLQSALTGMPIITTIHSKDANSLPHRMGRMIMQAHQKVDYQEVLVDIYYHFHYYFYLNKEETSKGIKRYISQINYVDNNGNVYQIYTKKKGKEAFKSLPIEAINELINIDDLKDTRFFKEENNDQ